MKRALGPGGVCCGDPEGCDIQCFSEQPAPAPAPVTEVDDTDVDLFDEEVDE